MAKHKYKVRNCSGGYWWITRPINKMNNKELKYLKRSKKFAKKYSMKKQRKHLKNVLW